jgi:hypothetical protein
MERIRTHLGYANVAATLALVFAMSGGAIAATGGFSSGGTLRACANEEGAIRLLKGGQHCKKGQKAVSWSQTGPAGAPGAKGAPGASGAGGAAGAPGPKGESGANGSARAYGVVNSAGQIVAAKSKNLTAEKTGTGSYCVRPTGGGINFATVQAIATVDHDDGSGDYHIVQTIAADSTNEDDCPGGWEFFTDNYETPGAKWVLQNIAFSVVVP